MLLVWGISATFQPRPVAALRLNESITAPAARPIKRPIIFKILVFLIPLNRLIVDRLGRVNLENRLLAANVNLLPEDFITLKELLFALAIFLTTSLKELFADKYLIFLVFLMAVSYLGSDIWLKQHTRRRQKMIVKVLPDAIDLLTLCVNSGLDFGLAVQWIVDKSKHSPLIEELSLFLMEIKVGKTRRQALQDMANRVRLPEMNSFVRTLVQAERLGTPVESALEILSEEVREFRFRRGERMALMAPIKMLFPLIFFIMPVVGIIVGGPIMIQFMKGGIPGF